MLAWVRPSPAPGHVLSSQRPGSLALALGAPAHRRTQRRMQRREAPGASSRVRPWDSPPLCGDRPAGEDTPDLRPDLTTD